MSVGKATTLPVPPPSTSAAPSPQKHVSCRSACRMIKSEVTSLVSPKTSPLMAPFILSDLMLIYLIQLPKIVSLELVFQSWLVAPSTVGFDPRYILCLRRLALLLEFAAFS